MGKGLKMTDYDKETPISMIVKDRMDDAGARYWANDNISEFISEDEKWDLIDELEEKFRSVLSSLIIDQSEDPNSMGCLLYTSDAADE